MPQDVLELAARAPGRCIASASTAQAGKLRLQPRREEAALVVVAGRARRRQSSISGGAIGRVRMPMHMLVGQHVGEQPVAIRRRHRAAPRRSAAPKWRRDLGRRSAALGKSSSMLALSASQMRRGAQSIALRSSGTDLAKRADAVAAVFAAHIGLGNRRSRAAGSCAGPSAAGSRARNDRRRGTSACGRIRGRTRRR